ncbi:hypothetical protein [Moorena bouillonii]|uniref:hypothetical protein n=1 Tax=Moorena bouillonii TaxID=207920 RepID=UPI0013012794|nr:hypothetical protein [Moorena bouillonii]
MLYIITTLEEPRIFSHIRYSLLPFPYSLLPTPFSRFPIPYYLFPLKPNYGNQILEWYCINCR